MTENYGPQDVLHNDDVQISDFGAWFKNTGLEFANIRNAVFNFDNDPSNGIVGAALVQLKPAMRQPEGWDASFYLLVFSDDAAAKVNVFRDALQKRGVPMRSTNLSQMSFEKAFLGPAITIPA